MKKEDKIIVTKYQIKGPERPLVKIALVSDLHDRNPDEVLRLLHQQRPDLILAAGDLMERHEAALAEWTEEDMDVWQGLGRGSRIFSRAVKLADEIFHPWGKQIPWDEENARTFLREASGVAPVFLGVGNHEWYFTGEDRRVMRENHVTLLDNADTFLRLKQGQPVRIGGLSTRYDLAWLHDFCAKSGFKILICHHPEYYDRFIRNTSLERQLGLVVSGHAHGGQWRIGKRGVMAPGQGLFPKYTHGVFFNKLVVSAGLANTANIPRFGNPRELVIISVPV